MARVARHMTATAVAAPASPQRVACADDVVMDDAVMMKDEAVAVGCSRDMDSMGPAAAVSPVSVSSEDRFGDSTSDTGMCSCCCVFCLRVTHTCIMCALAVIIFDWDDTLMASSWLAGNKLGLDSPSVPRHIAEHMASLSDSVCQLLKEAMKRGQVVIITNAETGWVELSAAKFMPAVAPLLPRVRVVSARSTYERMFPESPSDWKVAAFTNELYAAFDVSPADAARREVTKALRRKARDMHVISFGDSVYERTAVHAASARLTGASRHRVLTKSVKFVERPTAEQVRRQVDLVRGCLHDICSHDTALDLMLTIQLLEQHQQQQEQQ